MEQGGPLPPLVIMGVSGTGKTTIGAEVAYALGLRFVDGDDLHTAANKSKMRAGIPLDFDDRAPWLDAIGHELAASPTPMIACSALRRRYRDLLRGLAPSVFFIHLDGPAEVIAAYLRRRSHEFMNPVLLDSQLATLEALEPDEDHAVVPIDRPRAEVVADVLARLRAIGGTRATADDDPTDDDNHRDDDR